MKTAQLVLYAAGLVFAADLASARTLFAFLPGTLSDPAAAPAVTRGTNTLTTTPALTFPSTLVGTTSAPLNVIATAGAGNTGNVSITSCALSGAHAGDFAQTPAVVNVPVSPGASTVVPVRFSPAAGGARTATLTCNLSNGSAASFVVALSGTGGGAVQAQVTTRVSVSSAGGQGNGSSYAGSASADGRLVAFTSSASNLVSGDTNGTDDVFVRDRLTNQTQRVSVATGGSGGFGSSFGGTLSADGRHVAFTSGVSTLVPGDTNASTDVFVHDRATGETQRVSVPSGGGQGVNASNSPSLSADGRHVAFTSYASNLVPGDANGLDDVFVHDRQTGQTQRVSVATGGGETNHNSDDATVSADGRHVGFRSLASNLVAGDTNESSDVFVHDRQTGQTQRVSVPNGGGQSNSGSDNPAVSADGRYVAFSSWSNNLVAGDTNGVRDVFVHDRQTGQTQRLSVATGGMQANGQSVFPSLSADGRFVAFASEASNLVPGDTNARADVFVHDRQTGQTERVSVASAGGEGNEASEFGSVAADGLHVVFQSTAANLVPDDSNGSVDVFVRDRGGPDPVFSHGFE